MAGPRITARSSAIDVISVIPTTTPEEEEAEGDVLPSIPLGRRKRTTKKRREKTFWGRTAIVSWTVQ